MRISDWSSDVCSSDLESPARFRATTVAETAPTGCRNQLSHQDQCPCAAGEPWNDAPRHRIGTEQSPQAGRAFALGANPREALSAGRRDRDADPRPPGMPARTEEHTSELQSLMRITYAVF